jgi:hypothetical protein
LLSEADLIVRYRLNRPFRESVGIRVVFIPAQFRSYPIGETWIGIYMRSVILDFQDNTDFVTV